VPLQEDLDRQEHLGVPGRGLQRVQQGPIRKSRRLQFRRYLRDGGVRPDRRHETAAARDPVGSAFSVLIELGGASGAPPETPSPPDPPRPAGVKPATLAARGSTPPLPRRRPPATST